MNDARSIAIVQAVDATYQDRAIHPTGMIGEMKDVAIGDALGIAIDDTIDAMIGKAANAAYQDYVVLSSTTLQIIPAVQDHLDFLE